MRELMIHVERAVRPVRAGVLRKLRMRRELLAHLTTIFEEEKARVGDEPAALEAALRRFGDPAALTRELQETVPVVERLVNAPLPGSSGCIRSARPMPSLGGALTWGAGLAAVNVVAALSFVLTARQTDLITEAAGLTAVAATTFLFGFLLARMCEAISPAGGPRSWPRAAGFAVLATAALFVSSVLGSFYLTLDTRMAFERLPQRGGAVAFVVAGLAVSSFVIGRYKQSLHEWLSLDIGG
jgi:hypothetical protein